MAIQDADLTFSDAQNLAQAAGTYDSTNVLDLQAATRFGARVPVLEIIVETAFTTGAGGTLAVNLLTSDASNFSSPVTYALLAATAAATLVDGYLIYRAPLPMGVKEFNKLQYVIGTGAMTAGKVDAHIILDAQTNR